MRESKGIEQEAYGKDSRMAAATPMEADTLPDAHIAQLVQEERAEGSVDDLLDDHRPVE
jgi:hypothetical protein